MKKLQLTLKKHWFDLILCGAKTIEYRERKQHWVSRLENNGKSISFDSVTFINGYGATRPFLTANIRFIKVNCGKRTGDHGEQLTADEYYEIHLGDVIESGNLTS